MKSMYHAIKEKGPLIGVGHPGESSADFFRVEYEMNHMLHQSAVPQVSVSANLCACLCIRRLNVFVCAMHTALVLMCGVINGRCPSGTGS